MLYCAPGIPRFLGLILMIWFIVGGGICGFGVPAGLVRYDVRQRFDIQHGDPFTDILCGWLVPMSTITQKPVPARQRLR